jgi:hypothetical protein
MPIFAAIARSVRPNPKWLARRDAIQAKLVQAFNQQLKAGYDQIAASKRLSEQVMANAAAFQKSIDQQMLANRGSGAAGSAGGGRSNADRADDVIRGVDTTEDPMYGTSQHSFMEQYHWTDGYGNYRNTNDPNYNPSQNESGNWQLMPEAK